MNDFSIGLNTIEGIASFKMLMDNYIIPTLKSNEIFKNNAFIKNITTGVFENQGIINQF